MGFSLKDKFNEVAAQVNMRDGGKSAVTVRRAREAQVAQTIRQKQVDDENYRLNQQKANQRLLQQRNTGTIPTSNIQGGSTVLRPEVAQKKAYEMRMQDITDSRPQTSVRQLSNGLMVDNKKNSLGETIATGLATGIMNVAPQRLAGSALEFGGTLLGNEKVKNAGASLNKPFRDYGIVQQEQASNKAVYGGANVAGNLLTLPLAPAKGTTAFRAATAGLNTAADTSNAIRQAGGSNNAQRVGGITTGLVSGLLNVKGAESMLGKGAAKTGQRITTGLVKAGNYEGLENVMEGGIQDLVASRTYNKGMTPLNAVKNAATNYGLGFAGGAAVRAGIELPKATKTRGYTPEMNANRDKWVATYNEARAKGNASVETYAAQQIEALDRAAMSPIGEQIDRRIKKVQATGDGIYDRPLSDPLQRPQDTPLNKQVDSSRAGDANSQQVDTAANMPPQQEPLQVRNDQAPRNDLGVVASDPTNSKTLQVQQKSTTEKNTIQENRIATPIKQGQSLADNTTRQGETQLNTERLNLSNEQKVVLAKETQQTIDRLSNKDIQSLAKDAGIDNKTHTPEQIKKKIAEQLNVRQDAVSYMKQAEAAQQSGDTDLAASLLAKAAEQGRISRAQGTELAQQLQARKIIANTLDTPQQRIFKLLDAAGVNPDVYTKRLAQVDFNDSKQVIEAYRDMVHATKKDWIDTVRYNSMLSSPLTHVVNAFSNSVNVGVVAPIEKTIRGIADATGGLFGKERKYAAGEGAAYASGAAKNIKKAANEFMDVMRGIDKTQNLDLQDYSTPLAVKGAAGKAYSTLSFPMKMLGASDKFFRTLATAGEKNALELRQNKGIEVKGDINALADAEGSYRLYQQDTDLKGQGAILQAVDSVTNAIMKLRGDHMVFKFVFPFVKTPTNILKQGIEFSPLGYVNAINSRDKMTALTRASIGTAVFGTAAALIAAGDMTWAEPTDQEKKNRFRAEGKQPYSIRIGGKWVNLSKLPPAVSFPLAFTAGIHDAIENRKMGEDMGSAIFEGIARQGKFLSDQSYLKNMGDALGAFKGDAEKSVQAVANYPQQLIPFRALSGWIARMTDDTERRIDTSQGEIDKQVESLMQQIPGLRQKTTTRDYEGKPIPANNQVFNSFSPVRVTEDRGTSELDVVRDKYNEQQSVKRQLKKALTEGQKVEMSKMTPAQKQAYEANLQRGIVKDDGKLQDKFSKQSSNYQTDSEGNVYAQIGGEYKTFKSKDAADKAVFEEEFATGDKKTATFGNKVYLKDATAEKGFRTQSKSDYDYDKSISGVAIELDKAKAANNLDAYKQVAEKKYAALTKKLEGLDPETDFKEIDSVNKQILDLQQEYEKYDDQGYIRKGKSGKGKGSSFNYKMLSYGNPATSLNSKLQALLDGTKS